MEDLQRQIDELKNQIEGLKLDYPFTESIKDRFFSNTGEALTTDIELTGEAETITIPAQPSGTLTINYKGKTFKLLYE